VNDVLAFIGELLLVALVFWAVTTLTMRSTTALMRQRRKRRVIVTLKDELAFSGILYAIDLDCVVLREAEALAFGQKQANVAVDGELILQRRDIDYLQVVG
jgi:small nuclear ribonucleoprotein (snRNP)-like protein